MFFLFYYFRIIISVVLLVILVSGSKLSYGVKLNCLVGVVGYNVIGTFYFCELTSLDNPNSNLTIDGYSGEHEANKNDADGQLIPIDNTNIKYIPINLGSLLNLTALYMDNNKLKSRPKI